MKQVFRYNGKTVTYNNKTFTRYNPAFIFEVTVGAGNTLILPLPDGYTYDFSVDYGDGNIKYVSAYNDINASNTYASAGTYTVKITGVCGGFTCNLQGVIRSTLTAVKNWGNVSIEKLNFQACSNLAELPTDTPQLPSTLIDIEYLFYDCDSITSIPSGIFDNLTLTEFINIFAISSGITSIPADLFRYNTSATSFKLAFFGCSNLVDIPNNIFYYNNLVTDYYGVFYNCQNAVLPTTIFNTANLNIVTSFEYSFSQVDTANSMTGTVQDIWNYTSATSTGCFTNNIALTNYASIPAGWK